MRSTPNHRSLLADENSNEVDELIIEKKAIPELRFKFDIFKALSEMDDAEQVMNHYYRVNHIVNPNHQVLFECKMITVFNKLKMMITAQTPISKWSETDKINYVNLCKLEYNKKNFGLSRLMNMKNYLLRKAHQLNLTNLLKKEQDPMEEFKW